MVIIITDEGRFWNHENPVLEKYAECVVVVCLNGKKVTDKYRCIISPYRHANRLGMTDYSVFSYKYQSLASIKDKLRQTHSFHDDIVFLTDAEPQSLYPYLVLKDDEEYNRMHLWCMSPWQFEGKHRKTAYSELVYDIEKLTSLHYVDGNKWLEQLDKRTTMSEAICICQKWLNSMLPGALYEIANNLNGKEKYYYDLKKGRYISTQDSYSKVLRAKSIRCKQVEEFVPGLMSSMLGMLRMPDYPGHDAGAKAVVEQLHPRFDGKEVCQQLKRMRQALANENGIKLQTVDCPSTGPCAGTCERCDMEIRYLAEKLTQIEEENRKYPTFNVEGDSIGKKVKRVNERQNRNRDKGFMVQSRNGEERFQIPDFLKKTKVTGRRASLMSDIMAISRLRMGTDGKGITTLVGFYGCPLRCRYCVNKYSRWGETVRADYAVEELIEVLSVDEPYFLMSGGGVTFGGGEPLMQAAFIHELCCKSNSKWKKTIETSLYAPWEDIALLIDDIDYWYIDIKDINKEIYKQYTGEDNDIVIENLKKLVNSVPIERICVRVPLIPEVNTLEDRQKSIAYIRNEIDPGIKIDELKYILC